VGRAAAVLILLAAFVAWTETANRLPAVSNWGAVELISFALMPALFATAFLALPLRTRLRPLVGAFLTCVVGAIVLRELGAPVFANVCKFGAMTFLGWIFLLAFEELSWVVLVACVIPFVDAYSVWHGPTHEITTHHASVFTTLSVAFVVPGGTLRLGLPDVMFFGVFLGAAARFGLRPLVTWFAMLVGLALTMAATTFWAEGGLPALPAIGVGFLLANCDLLWARLGRPRLRPLEQ
jgi:hypothetical protein